MENSVKPKKKRRKTIRTIITVVIILAIVLVGGYFLLKSLNVNKSPETSLTKTTAAVQRGDIARTLGVSATLNSSETEDHMAEVSGEIISIRYKDGDFVEEGQIVIVLDTIITDDAIQNFEDQITAKLEQIDSLNDAIEDADSSIQDQYDNISDRKEEIIDLNDEISDLEADIDENEALRDKLKIYAPINGTVFNLQANAGDYVNNGTFIAEITNPLSYMVEMPFSVKFLNTEVEEVIIHYGNGDIPGEIISYADFTYTDAYGNELVDVIIEFTRYAALPDGARVKGTIVTDPILYKCVSETAPYYSETENIYPEIQGELLELYLVEKQSVKAGDLIAVIDSGFIDDTTDSIYNQINAKKEQIDALNDSVDSGYETIDQLNENILGYEDDIISLYDDITEIESDINEAEEGYINAEIPAQFDGIITDITAREGDEVSAHQKLFTLVSLDNPEMNLSIDELDITEVFIGLPAEVVIDALPETVTNPVTAVVTEIAFSGNTQGGVTTYSVTVALIESVEGFKLGMNATATVFTTQSIDTLYIPIEAVSIDNGNSFVWVTDSAIEGQLSADKSEAAAKPAGKGTGKRPEIVNKDTSTMTAEEKARYEEFLKNNEKNMDKTTSESSADTFLTVEEYYADATKVSITTGIHNEIFIEVLSGLTEGQIVVLPPVYISSSTTNSSTVPGMDLGGARKVMGGVGGGK